MGKVITIDKSFKFEAECYKHMWIIDLINKAVDKNAYTITNTDKLQRRVMIYVGKYLLQEEGNFNNRALIRRLVFSKLKQAMGLYGIQNAIYYEGFNDENEEASSYEPPDILANVEKIIEQRSSFISLIDTLASGDDKKRTVLTALASGYNDSQTADILANVCGGKSSGHRSFIKRFKKQCREALA